MKQTPIKTQQLKTVANHAEEHWLQLSQRDVFGNLLRSTIVRKIALENA